MTVSKSTVKTDIFKEFYDIINLNVADTHSPVRPKWIYSAFPDRDISTRSNYPVLVINSPILTETALTFKKGTYNFVISVDFYHTSSKVTDEKSDEIREAIETNKPSLAALGLSLVKLEDCPVQSIYHGSLKLHFATLTFTGKFHFKSNPGF